MISPIKIWRNQQKIAGLIGLTGEIVSWTYIRVPPAEFSSLAPYPVVLVRLQDKRCMMFQMVDYTKEKIKKGQKVCTVIRRVCEPSTDGVIPYYIKVKPV